MTTDLLSELTAALDAARIAGDYISREYEKFVPIPDARADISTDVDRGSQEIILQHLHGLFPSDGLCGEENTVSKTGPGTSGRMWVVDPIDGTRGFAKKNGEFSVMIGLTIDDVCVLGVVLEPVSGICTWARRGHGCWTDIHNGEPRRCVVRRETDITQGILVQSHSRPGTLSPPVELLKPAQVLEMYSAGLKMAVVARGEADVYVNTYGAFSDWDICAGHILVTEAGGVVSGLDGETITYGGPHFKQKCGLLASTAAMHPALVNRMAAIPRV